jgi:hypothetical protein
MQKLLRMFQHPSKHPTDRKNKLPYKLATATHLIVSLPLKDATID